MFFNKWIGCCVILLMISGFYYAWSSEEGSIQRADKDSVVVISDTAKVMNTAFVDPLVVEYLDGIYIGESPEWTGMTVKINIKHGKLKDVKVLNAKGTPDFYEEVVRKLPRLIEKSSTVDVDGITGATLSSESLKHAVRDALKKAEKKI